MQITASDLCLLTLKERWIFYSVHCPLLPYCGCHLLPTHPLQEDHGLSFLATRCKLLFHFWTPNFPNANVITQWIIYSGILIENNWLPFGIMDNRQVSIPVLIHWLTCWEWIWIPLHATHMWLWIYGPILMILRSEWTFRANSENKELSKHAVVVSRNKKKPAFLLHGSRINH